MTGKAPEEKKTEPTSWEFKDPKMQAAKEARADETKKKERKAKLLSTAQHVGKGLNVAGKAFAPSDAQAKMRAEWLK